MSAILRKYARRPRTTQERRANQERNDLLIRAKRRNLPSAYDDLMVHDEKSWKSKKSRKNQYHINKNGFSWHYLLLIGKRPSHKIYFLEHGYYFEYVWSPNGTLLRWYGK